MADDNRWTRGGWRSPAGISSITAVLGVVIAGLSLFLSTRPEPAPATPTGAPPTTASATYLFVYGTTMPGHLRYPLIEAAVAGLHVEYRHLAALCWNDRQAAVGVAEHEHGIETVVRQNPIDLDDHLADRFRRAVAGGSEEAVGRANLEIAEEDIVELAVVILAGMDEVVVAVLVELGDDAGQPDDLRPRPDHRQHPQTRHFTL